VLVIIDKSIRLSANFHNFFINPPKQTLKVHQYFTT